MDKSRNPYIRVPLAIAVLLMLYYMPTREFLKLTFILGVPFIFLLGFMVRKPRYSMLWNICALGLILIIGVYGYQLVHLPERVKVHRIVSEGAVLLAEGRYDEAITLYQELGELGDTQTMEEKIAVVEAEKTAQQQLEYAQDLINLGHIEEARQVLESITPKTRAGQEARELLRNLE